MLTIKMWGIINTMSGKKFSMNVQNTSIENEDAELIINNIQNIINKKKMGNQK